MVHLAGYTLDEKLHIAARHLVPRALREHGLLPGQLTLPQGALKLLVEGYTREAVGDAANQDCGRQQRPWAGLEWLIHSLT